MLHFVKRTKRMAACLVASVALLSGCDAFLALDVPETVIASCVRSSGFLEGTQINVEQQLRADALKARVTPSSDISQDKAYEINRCIEATVKGASALPNVAGVPQRVERRTNGTRVTETFTYGTPPAAQTVAAPAASYAAPGNRQCSLRMTGGTGYTCVGPNG